jgi:hypothetical protein
LLPIISGGFTYPIPQSGDIHVMNPCVLNLRNPAGLPVLDHGCHHGPLFFFGHRFFDCKMVNSAQPGKMLVAEGLRKIRDLLK